MQSFHNKPLATCDLKGAKNASAETFHGWWNPKLPNQSAKLEAKLLNWKPKCWEEVENRLQVQASFFENPNYF